MVGNHSMHTHASPPCGKPVGRLVLPSLRAVTDWLQDPKSRPTQLKRLREEVKYTSRLNPVPDDVDTLAPGDDLPPVPDYKVGAEHAPCPVHWRPLRECLHCARMM